MFAPFMGLEPAAKMQKKKLQEAKVWKNEDASPSLVARVHLIVTCHHTLTGKSRPAHSCCMGRITGTSTDIDAKILHGSKRNLPHSSPPPRESRKKSMKPKIPWAQVFQTLSSKHPTVQGPSN